MCAQYVRDPSTGRLREVVITSSDPEAAKARNPTTTVVKQGPTSDSIIISDPTSPSAKIKVTPATNEKGETVFVRTATAKTSGGTIQGQVVKTPEGQDLTASEAQKRNLILRSQPQQQQSRTTRVEQIVSPEKPPGEGWVSYASSPEGQIWQRRIYPEKIKEKYSREGLPIASTKRGELVSTPKGVKEVLPSYERVSATKEVGMLPSGAFVIRTTELPMVGAAKTMDGVIREQTLAEKLLLKRTLTLGETVQEMGKTFQQREIMAGRPYLGLVGRRIAEAGAGALSLGETAAWILSGGVAFESGMPYRFGVTQPSSGYGAEYVTGQMLTQFGLQILQEPQTYTEVQKLTEVRKQDVIIQQEGRVFRLSTEEPVISTEVYPGDLTSRIDIPDEVQFTKISQKIGRIKTPSGQEILIVAETPPTSIIVPAEQTTPIYAIQASQVKLPTGPKSGLLVAERSVYLPITPDAPIPSVEEALKVFAGGGGTGGAPEIYPYSLENVLGKVGQARMTGVSPFQQAASKSAPGVVTQVSRFTGKTLPGGGVLVPPSVLTVEPETKTVTKPYPSQVTPFKQDTKFYPAIPIFQKTEKPIYSSQKPSLKLTQKTSVGVYPSFSQKVIQKQEQKISQVIKQVTKITQPQAYSQVSRVLVKSQPTPVQRPFISTAYVTGVPPIFIPGAVLGGTRGRKSALPVRGFKQKVYKSLRVFAIPKTKKKKKYELYDGGVKLNVRLV